MLLKRIILWQHENKAYDILVKQLGEDDLRTQDAQNWIKSFKMREIQANAQKQKGQAVNAATAQKAIDLFKLEDEIRVYPPQRNTLKDHIGDDQHMSKVLPPNMLKQIGSICGLQSLMKQMGSSKDMMSGMFGSGGDK
ncbi:Clustered mitochondria protein [Acorus calamus]|uniref:Clustered mitochondria protein n=1 Tax=Acorus calamus TaxID=4465 RepID=A0AAV9BZE7_ACOCL|nr:Clustered mitochondria protein [Acorus calamus]